MDESTVYIKKSVKQPRLYVVCDDGVQTFSLEGRQTLGRPTRSSQPEIAVAAALVSRRQGEFMTTDSGCWYRDLGSTNGTRKNGRKLQAEEVCALKDGDVLSIHAVSGTGAELKVLMIYADAYPDSEKWETITLTSEMAELTVGRYETMQLQEQSVSRRHASFFHAKAGWAILDHNSTNGVLVNGKRIGAPVYLNHGDVVKIAGYVFVFLGERLLCQMDGDLQAARQNAPGTQSPDSHRASDGSSAGQKARSAAGLDYENRLSIRIEERNVWHRMRKQTLLKDINLEIPSGSMVLILGGSGAGKTTFMNAVMGYEKAEGQILYKNEDIYEEYEQMKYEIGYVPQQDLLRMNDTVSDTLLNAARMRLPSKLGEKEYERRALETMKMLGLERERNSLVGKLSGGQRKRLSIAVEYVGQPSLFFLDEPDSGLDGIMARELMDNLRTIADDGRIVMVISHSPDRAFELFDQVIILAKDSRDNCGHLVFTGSPAQACAFFETDNLEGIVRRINRPDEGGEGLAEFYIQKFEEMGMSK